MKILMISQMLPYPPNTGALQRIFNLLRHVSAEHEVHVVAFYQKALLGDTHTLDECSAAVREHCESLEVLEIPSDGHPLTWARLLALNVLSTTPFSVWRFRSRPMLDAVRRLLREHDFDAVHIETLALAPYAFAAADLPRIVMHHNVESSLLFRRSRNEKNPLTRSYLRRQAVKLENYEKRKMPDFDVNVAVSELDAEGLRALAPTARVEVIDNATDTEFFQPRPGPQKRELIFAGAMTWYPNRDAMVWFCQEVLPLIRKRVPDVVMNVVGRGPGPVLEQIGAEDEAVNVLGFVDDVRDPMGTAAVYVVPLRVGGGTRLKILDAMAMGKAVVSTTVGAEGLDLTAGEDIVLADEPQDFADRVVELLENDDRRASIERAARATVERRYSWSAIAPRLSAFYNELGGKS
jgi:sugar transferase (PEP-CTERM/EpsH1 system associated)